MLGLAPLTGVPLPFISYGSTNLTVLLAGMGLLLNVAGGRHVPICASWKDPAAMAPTIVIAAGGTAGHVVPALAVADALRAEGARRRLRRRRARRAHAGPRGRLRAAPDRASRG